MNIYSFSAKFLKGAFGGILIVLSGTLQSLGLAQEIRQICLIDMAYAKPDDITLLVLQTFADWQAPCWDAPLANRNFRCERLLPQASFKC